jgi:hypothetical protein
MSNYGIQASGHAQVTADAMAVGKGASASTSRSTADESAEHVIQRLRALADVIRANAAEVPQHDAVIECIDNVGAELGRETPNKLAVTALWSTVVSSVGSVASLSASVETIGRALAHLF